MRSSGAAAPPAGPTSPGSRSRFNAAPFGLAGPLLISVGTVLPLIAVGALAAFRRRSWSLGYLAAAGAFGLLGAIAVHSGVRMNDARFADLAAPVAMIGALAGAGALIGRWPASRRVPAALVVGLFAVMPTSLPGVIVAAQQAFTDPPSTSVTVLNARAPSLAYTRFSSELALNWDFYNWLARTLPADARLLTPYPAVAASLAGVSAPTSGPQPAGPVGAGRACLRGRAALPAPRRSHRHGHHPPARHRPSAGCVAPRRPAAAERSGPLHPGSRSALGLRHAAPRLLR